MKQDEARESFRQTNYHWAIVMQKMHNNRNVELFCLQALYPELFLPERQAHN